MPGNTNNATIYFIPNANVFIFGFLKYTVHLKASFLILSLKIC